MMRSQSDRGRRSQPRLLPVLALACAFLAAALAVASGKPGQTTGGRKKPVFDEAELERYRVDIHPVTPSHGIMTGCVVAYGYYLVPPYEVTTIGGRVFVNGVQVDPPLPLPRDNGPILSEKLMEENKDYLAISGRLAEATISAMQNYRASLAQNGDTAAALTVVYSTLFAHPTVRRVEHSSRFFFVVFGPEAMRRGRMKRTLMFMELPRQEPPARSSSFTKSVERLAALWRKDLAAGGVRVVTHGMMWRAPSTSKIAAMAAAATDTLATTETQWQNVASCCDSYTAYDIVANLEYSRPTWQAFAARLGSGK